MIHERYSDHVAASSRDRLLANSYLVDQVPHFVDAGN